MTKEQLDRIENKLNEISKLLNRKSKEGKLISCSKCGYSWITRSDKQLISCPGCNAKTKNEIALKEFSDIGKTNKSNIDKQYKEGHSIYDLNLD